MKYNIIPVQTPKATDARLYTYILDNFEEIDSNRTRPLVLICPGGGYEFTSDREAEAVAVQYIARGFHACGLRYSVAPAEFPQSLCELAWSVAYLREHAKEYGIKPDKIIVSGFSAGGHLAASLGVFWDKDWLDGNEKEQRIRRAFKSGASGRKAGAAGVYLAYLNGPVGANPEYTDVYGSTGKESGFRGSSHFPGRTAWTFACQ